MPFRRTTLLLLAVALLTLLGDTAPHYYVVFLRPDPARATLAPADSERIQAAHMANIRKMAADGILIAAGPFEDSTRTISGVFVMKTASLDEARRIAAQDPTVVEHRNTVDVHSWQGPPDLSADYFRLHKLDPKTPENMQVHPFCFLLRGPAWETAPQDRPAALSGHARYVSKLREQGKLGAAGPVDSPGDLQELIAFKVIPLDEAQRLLDQDPAVQAGILRVESHRWWVSEHVLPW